MQQSEEAFGPRQRGHPRSAPSAGRAASAGMCCAGNGPTIGTVGWRALPPIVARITAEREPFTAGARLVALTGK